ncbi:Copia protein [Phytophthora megakarya]|uniref:Copia protein n=1 Tax=Phytophthora megakarya TaxID=4795 RepID=A0A225WFQ9_9STRA|nr:Copia protein [Phytophthora megakarya]
MEAEFVAASEVTAEMLGVVELLSEIELKVKMPYKRFKCINDLSRNKGLEVKYSETKLMRAGILTKPLPAPRLEELRVVVMLTT